MTRFYILCIALVFTPSAGIFAEVGASRSNVPGVSSETDGRWIINRPDRATVEVPFQVQERAGLVCSLRRSAKWFLPIAGRVGGRKWERKNGKNRVVFQIC